MKSWTRVLCLFLAALILAAADFGIWQRDNLSPIIMGRLFSKEKLENRMQNLLEEQEKELASKGVTVKGFTKSEIRKMLRGELDEKAAKELLKKKQQANDAKTKPAETKTVSDSPSAEAVLNECMARLYAYEGQLYSELGAAWQDAVNAWSSTPIAQRTSAVKNQIKSESINRCYNMEVTADNRVSDILAEYREKIVAAGGNASDVDALWSVYCAKKSAVKAYYYSLVKT